MTLYCQSCDYSFTDHPTNAPPSGCCPQCGGAQWATWKRGEAPAILDLSRMTPAFNAGATAPGFVFQPNAAQNYLFGAPVPINSTGGFIP